MASIIYTKTDSRYVLAISIVGFLCAFILFTNIFGWGTELLDTLSPMFDKTIKWHF
jgi:hypothetical protein